MAAPRNRRPPRSALRRPSRRHSKSSPAAADASSRQPQPWTFALDEEPVHRFHQRRAPPPSPDHPALDCSDLRSEYSDSYAAVQPSLSAALRGLQPAGKGRLTGGEQCVRPESQLQLEGDQLHQPEYRDSFVDSGGPRQRPNPKRPLSQLRAQCKDQNKENEWLKVSEAKARYVAYPEAKRPALRRRSTSLCLEGDFLEKTSELHSSYPEYAFKAPFRLSRRPTSLCLEGDLLEKTSELHSSYPEHAFTAPLRLSRRPTSLCLEGSLDTSRTEQREAFVEYELQPLRHKLRRPTQLMMEGDGFFTPEYRDKFVEFPRERPSMKNREGDDHVRQIRPGDDFETATEAKDNYKEYPVKRRVPDTYCHQAVETDHLRQEGDFEGCSELHSSFVDMPRRRNIARPMEDHLKPEGTISKTTELKSEFVDFPRQRNIARALEDHLKPEGEMLNSTELNSSFVDFPRQRNISRPIADNLKPEGDLDSSTELKSEFVDFPRQRNIAKPIEDHLRPEGEMLSSTELNSSFVDFPRQRFISRPLEDNLKPAEGVMDASTEIKSEFVNFPRKRNIAKPIEDHLRPEGEMLNTTELNSSFVDFPRQRNISRPIADNLRPEGDLDASTEIKSEFVDFPRQRNIAKPIEDHLRPEGEMEKTSELHSSYVDFPRQRPVVKRQCSSLKAEGSMQGTTENSSYFSGMENACKSASFKRDAYLQLGGEIDIRPEYSESFVDHPRRRPELRKPEGEMRRLEGRIDTDPEYRSSYLDYPRQRPIIKKPSCQLKRSGMATAREESRGPYTPSFLNNSQHNGEKAFRVLNVSGAGSQPILRQDSTITTSTETTDSLAQSAPTYRLHVQNVDDENSGGARGSFVVLPDPNHNLDSTSGSRWLRNKP